MARSPNYATMPDFAKVKFLEDKLRDRTDDLREKHGEVVSLRSHLEASQADAYDFQKKSQQLENENKGLREENRRLGRGGEEELRRVNGMLKRLEHERGKLMKVVGNKEEAIERIRRRRDREIRDKDLEIQELDETIHARNDEVNALKETNKEMGEKVRTLEHHVDIEKRTADKYKDAAEKYQAAGPALERLNKILAKYLGDHLQDGFDWPPGHPNNKMDKALSALEDELAKAGKEAATTTAASAPAADETKTANEHHLTLFPQPKSGTDTSNLSWKEQIAANMAKRDRLQQSKSDGESFTDNNNDGKSSTSKFKDAMSNAFKGKRDHENEFIPESPLAPAFAKEGTPTKIPKAQRPGLNTNVTGNRNFSLFGNATSAVDDDSPKPSEKVFGDLDGKKRPSRFTNRLVPMAEPEIVYRDREVIRWRDCDRKHIEDCDREHADEVESPTCSRLHVEDCPYEHVDDTYDGEKEPVIEYRDREVVREVPIPCAKAHAEDIGPCARKHAEDVEPCPLMHIEDMVLSDDEEKEAKIEYVEVPMPCKKTHVDERKAGLMKGLAMQTDMTRQDISEFVRLASQTQTVSTPTVREKIVEKPVEKIIYKDKILEKPVEVIKIQTKYQDRIVFRPRHPLATIFYFYFDIWTCLVEWCWRYDRTAAILQKLQTSLPYWMSDWVIGKPLSGSIHEIVHEEGDWDSLQNAKHAILKRMNDEAMEKKGREDSLETVKATMNRKKDPVSPPPSAIGLNRKNSAASDATVTANGTGNGSATAGKQDEHYLTATQYIIRRPLFISNLIMAIFFTALLPFTIASLILWSEYADLLDYNGVIRPAWFTLPTWNVGGGGYGSRGYDNGLFIVDRDWSWVYYLYRGVMGGWLRQVRFYLMTEASGGAGFRMPG